MRRIVVGILAGTVIVGFSSMLWAQHKEHKDLPAGPIKDRHELMERIGDQAKIIGDALKSGKFDPIGPAAEKIHAESEKALPMFPEGSTHPNSRSKPEIWKHWSDFEAKMKAMQDKSAALVTAAKESGDVRASAQAMFDTCKQCHDDYRVPKK